MVIDDLIKDLTKYVGEPVTSYEVKLVTPTTTYRITPGHTDTLCNHKWYATDMHDVEQCFGAICANCGKLSCMCEVTSPVAREEAFKHDPITNELIGNQLYKKFHEKES